MEASNGGNADGVVTGCQIGSIVAKSPSSQARIVIAAGSTISLACLFPSLPAGAVAGQSVSGTLTVNGSPVSWSGTYES